MMFIPFPFCKIKDFVVKSITLYHFGVIKGRRKICIYAIFVNISNVILIFINIMTVFFDIFCVLDKIAGENGEEEIQAERAERFYTLYFRKILL